MRHQRRRTNTLRDAYRGGRNNFREPFLFPRRNCTDENFHRPHGIPSLSAKEKDFVGKAGGVLAVARRSGVSGTCNQMLTLLTALGVSIPSSGRVFAIGREKGEVLNDKEGIGTAKNLGKSIVDALR